MKERHIKPLNMGFVWCQWKSLSSTWQPRLLSFAFYSFLRKTSSYLTGSLRWDNLRDCFFCKKFFILMPTIPCNIRCNDRRVKTSFLAPWIGICVARKPELGSLTHLILELGWGNEPIKKLLTVGHFLTEKLKPLKLKSHFSSGSFRLSGFVHPLARPCQDITPSWASSEHRKLVSFWNFHQASSYLPHSKQWVRRKSFHNAPLHHRHGSNPTPRARQPRYLERKKYETKNLGRESL